MLLPGNTLSAGRYVILSKLAEGGQAIVYLADDVRLGRKVVVKEFYVHGLSVADQQATLLQFEQTGKLMAQLNHAGITQVYDVVTENGVPCLVTEYVQGHTLEAILQGFLHGLPQAIVIQYGIRICEVLAYLHSLQPPVIYRDLKPDNVMISQTTQALKLVDFGIARTLKSDRSQDTMLLGSPGYAPQEQYGQAQTKPASDVYSLGVTLLRLATGYDPTNSANPFVLPRADQVNTQQPISPEFADVLERATQQDMRWRYQSADELKADLHLLQQGRAPTKPLSRAATPAAVITPRRSFSRVVMILAGVTMGMAMLGGVMLAAGSINTWWRSAVTVTATIPVVSTIAQAVIPTSVPPSAVPTSASRLPTLVPGIAATGVTTTEKPTSIPPTNVPTASPMPIVSGNVTRIVFARGNVGCSKIIVRNLDTKDEQEFRHMANNEEPAWGPDGTQFVAAVGACGSPTSAIAIFNTLTKQSDIKYNSSYVIDPDWGSDDRIYFVRGNGNVKGGGGDIWVMNANGTSPVATGLIGRQPTLSPDGQYLAYMNLLGTVWRVMIAQRNSNGTFSQYSTVRLSFDDTRAVNSRMPNWSNDSKRVLFNVTTSDATTLLGLAAANLTGTMVGQVSGRFGRIACGLNTCIANTDDGLVVIRESFGDFKVGPALTSSIDYAVDVYP